MMGLTVELFSGISLFEGLGGTKTGLSSLAWLGITDSACETGHGSGRRPNLKGCGHA